MVFHDVMTVLGMSVPGWEQTLARTPMADGNRGRDTIKDVRRHNLRALTPDRRRPTLAQSLTAIERDRGLRFILQTAEASTPEQLAEAIWNQHRLVIDVEPLFIDVDQAADANDMDHFFLATLPGLAQRDLADDVFDIGYALSDTPDAGLLQVEPDLPHAVSHGTPEITVAGNLNPCEVDAQVPGDRAWHLRSMRVPLAWTLTPPGDGRQLGEGSMIGHIDTGWAAHDDVAVANVRLDLGHDFIDDDADPRDPLEAGSFLGGPASPGHGIATSSVIIARGDGSGALPNPAQQEMWGVAPRATLVPLRAIRFVFFLFDSDVAQAIKYAADRGCHVISMSLGGVPTTALEAAVNYAVAKDVIVCAAAGNCLPAVSVGPAIYPNCIAVAGSNVEDRPWQFSSRGAKVAVTAPAENVWAARRAPGDASTTNRAASQGTSFAVAGVAGVAALWLAFHGRNRLLDRYQGPALLHHVFQHLLRQTARPSSFLPAGEFGTGIVDAHALLSAPLPDAATIMGPTTIASLTTLTQPAVIAAMYGCIDPALVRAELTAVLAGETRIGAEETVEGQANAWAPEIIHILAQDQAAYRQFAARLASREGVGPSPQFAAVTTPDAALVHGLSRRASRRLRAALARRSDQPTPAPSSPD